MKKLALLLLAVASYAHAGDVASMSNQAGGLIILTDVRAPTEFCKDAMVYYTTDANGGNRGYGCYNVSNPWVVAKDAYGKYHQWPMANFTMTDYGNTKYGN